MNWFEEDVFDEGPFDRFGADIQQRLEKDLAQWNHKQMETWNRGRIPFNSPAYDIVTQAMYAWLQQVNPEVQNIQWNARHNIMVARVARAIAEHRGKRILCIHGADHNYWYRHALGERTDIELVYPLR
ncbi:hypothetical protein HIJ39_15280 [Sulfobacillus sp. DSM 109850]|uniref:Uncharacterized protein n=1 Tax=Sulfobacillus harzensis TaxID=2729629 RepID=A0A7Y0Q3T1_9FIRM|nr:hypothetical protein [Sulfobacillus harzensis]